MHFKKFFIGFIDFLADTLTLLKVRDLLLLSRVMLMLTHPHNIIGFLLTREKTSLAQRLEVRKNLRKLMKLALYGYI